MRGELEALARTVLGRNLAVRSGESVVIESWPHTLDAARAFVTEARRRGARPTVLYEDERAWWQAVQDGRFGPLGALGKAEAGAIAGADAYIYFWGPEDRPRLTRLPPKQRAAATGYNEEWYRRARASGLRGARMTLGQVTAPAARALHLPLGPWRRQMIAAGSVEVGRMRRAGERIRRRLERGSEMTVRHPNGTDLTIPLARRHFTLDVGEVPPAGRRGRYETLANNPSGQLRVAVDGSAARGDLVGNRPIYLAYDRYDGARWSFRDGRLTRFKLDSGAAKFRRDYRAAPAGRDRFGFFAIGLNPRARELPPCEDFEAGPLLIGDGNNAFSGGRNRNPFLGYALLGGATVEVDGTPIVRDGRLR